MLPKSISLADLRSQLKEVLHSTYPIRVVLNKNVVCGLIVSQQAAQLLLKSGALNQIREELWELNDKDTVEVVYKSRKGDYQDSILFDDWVKKRHIHRWSQAPSATERWEVKPSLKNSSVPLNPRPI